MYTIRLYLALKVRHTATTNRSCPRHTELIDRTNPTSIGPIDFLRATLDGSQLTARQSRSIGVTHY